MRRHHFWALYMGDTHFDDSLISCAEWRSFDALALVQRLPPSALAPAKEALLNVLEDARVVTLGPPVSPAALYESKPRRQITARKGIL